MGKSAYQAADTVGKILNGTIESENRHSVFLSLKSKGLYPIAVSSVRKIDISSNFLINWRKVSDKEVLVFILQLSTMIKAGMSLVNSFDTIITQVKDAKFKKNLLQIQSEIAKGRYLSDVTLQYSSIFPPLFSNIVRAGEESGKLDLVLVRYAEYLKKKNKINSEIKAALVYPCILFALSIAVIIFLTSFIVPKFADIIKSSGTELPGTMKILLNLSSFIRDNYHFIIVSIILIIFTVLKYIKSEKGSYYFDVFKLKIPILGQLIYKTIISRFVRTMSTLLASGVPFLKNLKLATNVIDNKVMVKKLESTFDNISKGDRVARQFEESGIFPPIVIQMITVGENSGSLDKMFDEIANIYDEELEAAVKKLTTALEPIVLIFVASAIGFIAVSLVSSLMEAINSFK